MTSATPERLRWWEWLGPWPLRPVALGIIVGVFALSTNAFDLDEGRALAIVSAAAASGAVTAGVLALARWAFPRGVMRPWGYALTLTAASLAANLVRWVTGTMVDFERQSALVNFIFTSIRSVAFLALLLAIFGIVQRRLEGEVERGDRAQAALVVQAEALLVADERVRQQVAQLLHDRVQAGLVAACLQLRRSIRHPETREEDLERVIDDLERLRGMDVGSAVHALRPNLRELDLLTALEELADAYRPGLEVTCTVDVDADLDQDTRLAAYRIIEQGLLNAARHSEGRSVHVSVSTSSTGVDVKVADDGRGLVDGELRPGLGTAVIEAWCRLKDGTWSLEPRREGGAILRASLPAGSP